MKRAGRWLALGVAAAAVALVAAVGVPAWRVVREVWTLRSASASAQDDVDEVEIKEAAERLAALGKPGRLGLEWVAFASDRPPHDSPRADARLMTLTRLFKLDADEGRLDDDRLARYLLESAGLVFPSFPDLDHPFEPFVGREERPASAALRAALEEVLLHDPHEARSTAALSALGSLAGVAPEPLVRRAALEAPHEQTRATACGLLFNNRAEDVPVLRRALADPAEEVRVRAALTLAWPWYGAPDCTGVPVLVAALRRGGDGNLAIFAAQALALAHAREADAAIAAAEDREWEVGESRRDIWLYFWSALARMEDIEVRDGARWADWVEAHKAELPPQLDPEAIPVGPLVVTGTAEARE